MSLATPTQRRTPTPTPSGGDDLEEEGRMPLRVDSECIVVLKRARDVDGDSVPRGSAAKRRRTTRPPSPTPEEAEVSGLEPKTDAREERRRKRRRRTEDEPETIVVESVDVNVAVDAPRTPPPASVPVTTSTADIATPPRLRLTSTTEATTRLATPPSTPTTATTPTTTTTPLRAPGRPTMAAPSTPTASAAHAAALAIPSTPKTAAAPATPSTPKATSTPSPRPNGDRTQSSAYRQRVAEMRLRIDAPRVVAGHESATRRSQITPPPSDRMLDRRNPPQPPRKAKKRRRLLAAATYPSIPRGDSTSPTVPLLISPARVPIVRLPRLSSDGSSRSGDASPAPSPASLLMMMQPPQSRVFRSLEAEFDAAANDPPLPLRLRPPPLIPRVTRGFPVDHNISPVHTASETTPRPHGTAARVRPRATRAPSATAAATSSTTTTTTTTAVSSSVCREEERLHPTS